MITPDASAPLVVVVGATGTQGGSVISALSESDKPYRLRGVTRDTSKQSSTSLAARGVEMVSASLTAATKDQIQRVFEGAAIIFAVTNFWEHTNKKREIDDGKAMVDAAKAVNVKLFVWSGLEDVTAVSDGKYTAVDHFDGKAAITQYAKDQGVPLAIVQAGPYMSNFSGAGGLKKQADGTYALTGPASPESPWPLLDTYTDYGKFVRAAIESPGLGAGSEVLACSEEIPWTEVARILSEGTGKPVVYKQLTEAEYMASTHAPEHIAREICQMYQYIEEFGYFARKDLKPSKAAVKGTVTTWAEYVKKTDWTKAFN